MKNIKFLSTRVSVVVLLLSVLASCNNYKKELSMLNQSRDSIQNIVDTRNDQILDYIISFNTIQENLDSIKTIQRIINTEFNNGITEHHKNEKDQILDDIALINNLLNQNKSLVTSLKKKLRQSGLKTQELEQMIQNYSNQIKEKDQEIVVLKEQLGKLKMDVSNLNQQVNELTGANAEKSQTIVEQNNRMNEAFYCYGTKDELLENNVIEKTGGFLGIGKTIKIKSDFNQDYFSKVDKRKFNEVLLMTKTAELLTVHPDSSYHYTTSAEMVQNLIIDDPNEFWKASNYLIILVEQ